MLAADLGIATNIENKNLLAITIIDLSKGASDFEEKMVELESITLNSARFIILNVSTYICTFEWAEVNASSFSGSNVNWIQCIEIETVR